MGAGLKPWYSARWETVEPEPEEVYKDSEVCYDEPTENELLDYEDKNGIFSW
ncbi:Hypothetical protein KNT65_gp077 [Escherichia phage EcS1]|uniref:Uncharacterized protein n=1 Tax=Escherichia phage EcS1 TaxID=2083276 RepID=A0A2Z5ZCD2_9CAUD|nr:Hypothetical protein KNT65_gp077 [Escherichia phage EcS1]BBC78125.1 Hypothetical protein [Escherichia phage EcS1]